MTTKEELCLMLRPHTQRQSGAGFSYLDTWDVNQKTKNGRLAKVTFGCPVMICRPYMVRFATDAWCVTVGVGLTLENLA